MLKAALVCGIAAGVTAALILVTLVVVVWMGLRGGSGDDPVLRVPTAVAR